MFTLDFSREDAGVRYHDVPFRYETPTSVEVHAPEVYQGRASIRVDIKARGIVAASCTYALEPRRKVLEVDWLLDKEDVLDPESVIIAFPFNLGDPRFRLDLGGVPSAPHDDQIPGAVRDYFPIQRWAGVNDGSRGVVLASLEEPLVQHGDVTAATWNRDSFDPESPTILAWPLNNHWEVNFKASQDGEIPLRYRLTTHEGPTDDAFASRFAAEQAVVPIVLRDRVRTGPQAASFVSVDEDSDVLVVAKPAERDKAVILRYQNLRNEPQAVPTRLLSGSVKGVAKVTPIEAETGDTVALEGPVFTVELAPREVASFEVSLG